MDGISLQAVPMIPKRSQGTPLPVKSRADVALPVPIKESSSAEIDLKIAHVEQRRVDIVRDIANKFVLGDTKLSMFYKDSGGQYITRYVNLRDGKVTYIPEPTLLSQTGHQSPTIRIDA